MWKKTSKTEGLGVVWLHSDELKRKKEEKTDHLIVKMTDPKALSFCYGQKTEQGVEIHSAQNGNMKEWGRWRDEASVNLGLGPGD